MTEARNGHKLDGRCTGQTGGEEPGRAKARGRRNRTQHNTVFQELNHLNLTEDTRKTLKGKETEKPERQVLYVILDFKSPSKLPPQLKPFKSRMDSLHLGANIQIELSSWCWKECWCSTAPSDTSSGARSPQCRPDRAALPRLVRRLL